MINTSSRSGLWTARLERAEKANALTREMLLELADFAEAAHGVAKVLVLTGAGNVFSAGMDLQAAQDGLATDPVWERLSAAVAGFGGLSIAALNGTVAGGAMGMVLACDLRIAVPQARFFYPVMSLGFLPQPSDPARLVALVGPARAKRVLMAGQKISSEEALDWGLVDHVVGRDALTDTVQALATDVLAADRSHAARIKALIARS